MTDSIVDDGANARRYLRNPDVSCREEEPEGGALLFNPDTDAILVINAIGVLIWEALEQPRTRQELVAHLIENCEGVPADQVSADVEAFLKTLMPEGFVGEVLEESIQ